MRKIYEEKLLKINENVVGNLVLYGVYGGGNLWMKFKMDVKWENILLFSDSVIVNCGWFLFGLISGNIVVKVIIDGNL